MTARASTPLVVGLLVLATVGATVTIGALASNHLPEESTAQDTSYLRVVHASPDAPAVDVYVDNESAMTNVSFGDVGEYIELEAGEHNLTITPAGDPDTTVFEADVTLEARSVRTVAAAGEFTEDTPTDFQLRNFTDDPLVPAANDSAVRVAHLSPDAETVDVTADNGSVVLAENVSFGNASDYVNVPSGEYAVEVREDTEAANGTVLLRTNVTLESGQAHTAWALGYLNTDPTPVAEPLEVAVTQDATMSIHLPGEMTPTPTAAPNGTATATPNGTVTGTPAGTATPNGTATATTP